MSHSGTRRRILTLALLLVLLISFFASFQPMPSGNAASVATYTLASSGTIRLLSSGWENSGGTDVTDGGLWTYSGSGASVVTSPVHNGVYACSFTAGTGGGYSYVHANITDSSTQCNLRFYVDFSSLPSGGSCPLAYIGTSYGSGSYGIRLELNNNGAGTVFHIDDCYGNTYASGTTILKTNVWYCVELQATESSTTGSQLYLNGNLEIHSTASSHGYSFTSVGVGIPTYDGSTSGGIDANSNHGGNTVSLVIDSVVAGISYIGASTAQTKITFSGSPSYNATRAGGVTQFQISVSSGSGVAGYVFFNGLSNSTYIPVAGAPVTLQISSTETLPSFGTVSVEWYAKGTDGTWGSSGLFTFPVFQMAQVLTANGNKLYLSNGKSIVLHGVDYTYFLDSPNGSWMLPDGAIDWQTWDTTGLKDFVNLCQAWNVNVVRVILTVQFWDVNYALYESHLAYFANQLQQKGIFVDYCFYRNNASESEQGGVLPWQDNGNGYINNQQDFINLWSNFSAAFANSPNVLFEFWNEPSGNAANEASWMSITQSCINAVRATGASNPIVVQWGDCLGYDYSTYPSTAGTQGMDMSFVTAYPLNDPAGNIIYSDHVYRSAFRNSTNGYAEPYLMNDATGFNMLQGLNLTGVLSVAQNHPVWMGEIGDRLYGMPDSSTYEDAWFNNTLGILDEYGIGYAGWAAPPWRSGVGEQWGFVVGGSANYALDSSGTIFVNHLLGESYSVWIESQLANSQTSVSSLQIAPSTVSFMMLNIFEASPNTPYGKKAS